jgi:NAD(P) transhydrogenase subunit alpha
MAADLMVFVTIFVLALFVGFEVITKVPPTLHTPLMSGSNAISGITVVGAVVAAGQNSTLAVVLGFFAVVFAMINVVGGFLVTHRMLLMFKSQGPGRRVP